MATWSVLNKTGLTYLWGKVKSALAGKQDTLVSGTNIKTVNNNSLLGSGNINIPGGTGTITEVQANGASVATSGVANIPAATHLAYGVTKLSTYIAEDSYELAASASSVAKVLRMAAWYGDCSTPTQTAEKTTHPVYFRTVDGLVAGAHITVKFTYANTAANPTLNVSSTGAKPIYVGSRAAGSGDWNAGDVKEFVYDGTNWVMTAVDTKVTLSTTDIGEGSTLAANTLYGVYE